ncbi:MAG: aminotransferase class V-fold PLP-dependent enzyme [Nitrospiraceae bacterium]
MLYFNHAGLSPAGPEVLHAMNAAADTFGTMLYSESGIAWYRKQVKDCGNRIAELLHIDLNQDRHRLLLCPNATSSLRIILSLIGLQPGDVVITSDQEHLSTLQALSGLTQRGIAAHVVRAATEEHFLSRFEDACHIQQAALVLLSHVTHSDGRIFPVEQICEIARKRAIPVAIDGAQAVGHIPVHIGKLPADFYYFSGHKWCAGPMGSGALLIAEHFNNSRSNRRANSLKENDPDVSCLDLGTQNVGLIAGLGTACSLRQQTWPAMGRLAELHRLCSKSLRRVRDVEIVGWDGAHAPGIVSFRVQRPDFDPTGIASYLSRRYEIVLKPVQYHDLQPLLRVSWSFATGNQDIVFLAEKLEEALERFTCPSSG